MHKAKAFTAEIAENAENEKIQNGKNKSYKL